jgi:SET domain-containing protein
MFQLLIEQLLWNDIIKCYKQELTYDYGYELDSVIGPEGKIKELPCYCGTADCRKRLY